MQIKDIFKLPIAPHMSSDVKFLRKNSPKMLKDIIEKGYVLSGIRSLKELTEDSIQALGGGMLSAVYLLKQAEESLVVKFRYSGITAEAEAMREWAKKGANVVQIRNVGVTTVGKKKKKIKYLIPEAILDKHGNPAITADEYASYHPEKVRLIGYKLGEELAKIHQATTNRTFGEFLDTGGTKAPYKSWNSYLASFWNSKYNLLKRLGLPSRKINKVTETIQNTNFSQRGIYVHGDFSMRNAVVERTKPLKLKIFDPNPIIGDPSWDIAILYNNYEYSKRRFELKPNSKSARQRLIKDQDCLEGFIEGYEKTSNKRIERSKVLLSQLIQTTFLLEIEQNKALKRGKDLDKVTEVIIRKEALLEKSAFISQMSYLA